MYNLSTATRKWKPKPAQPGRPPCQPRPGSGSPKPLNAQVPLVAGDPEMEVQLINAPNAPKG